MGEKYTLGQKFADSKFASKHQLLRGLFVRPNTTVWVPRYVKEREGAGDLVKSWLIVGEKKKVGSIVESRKRKPRFFK